MASIRKRIRDNGAETWVVDYYDQHGKRHLKTFDTKKAAIDWRVQTQAEVRDGIHTPERDSVTVAEAAVTWLRRCETEGLERSTVQHYRIHVDKHIVPRIGRLKLAKLSAPMIEEFRDRLVKDHSKPYARKILVSLKSILKEAFRRGLVSQNVAISATIVKRDRDTHDLQGGRDFPSTEEVNQIINGASGRWRPLLITAIFTGMRSSELRGLTWEAVDFAARKIHVRQRADVWNVMGAPKSKRGRRAIPMSPMVFNTLREWKLACPRGSLGIVFPNKSGNVESHANIVSRGFQPLQAALGMVADGKPKYGLHALRHFFASWMFAQGHQPENVQLWLGHSSLNVTLEVYRHLIPGNEARDQELFADAERALLATGKRPTD
jgi:integrase